ncbi:MAG: hypothetical protein R3C27_07305 [Hyphomonadaceae bacterium]
MTLATVSETPQSRRLGARRAGQLGLGFNALLMAASLAVCAAFFAQGGLEASLFCIAGAILGARGAAKAARLAAAYSGAFAGLFVGAVFAGFFHGALVALVTAL